MISEGGGVNAASYATPDIPGGALAPGAIVSVFGAGFGPAPPRIEIETSAGEVFPAELLHLAPGQLNIALPEELPVGEHRLRVVGDVPSNHVPVKVVRSSFGLFHRFEREVPVAAAQVNEDGGVRLVTLERPARPGDVITLWGTGLGPRPAREPKVWVAGRKMGLLFAGRSPCCVGVDQISFRLPDDTATGCVVPVAGMVGSMISNVASLPVSSDGRSCEADGPAGIVQLTRSWALGLGERMEPTDSARANFGSAPDRLHPDRLPPHGACMVWRGETVQRWFNTHAFIPQQPFIGAGEVIEIESPVVTLRLTRDTFYTRIPDPAEPFLGPGPYRVSAPGDVDFPTFTAALHANPAPIPDSAPFLGFARIAGTTVSWEGGAPDDDLVVWSQSSGGAVDLVCRANVGQESLEIPQELIANLRDGGNRLRTVAVGVAQSAPLEFDTDGPEHGLLLYREEFLFADLLPAPHLASTPVILPDGSEIQAEVAANFAERQRGLMAREHLLPDHGMLFLFETSAAWSFWMLNTLIPLDMIWLNEQREIIFIQAEARPCGSSGGCPTYNPNQPSRYVLELAGGEAARRNLRIGDRLSW